MAAGLRIHDSAGNVMLDTSTRVAKLLGTVTIGGGNQSGSVTDANFALGTPFSFLLGASDIFARPNVSFAGTTMSWAALDTFAGTLLYGIY